VGITLNLPVDLESQLSAEAARRGVPLDEYLIRVLCSAGPVGDTPKTGAQLVAYWADEGLIGSRPDIAGSSQHARCLRQEAERQRRE